MDRKWLLIPEYSQLKESVALAEQYNAGFEYNDFFEPSIYEDSEEVRKRIAVYKELMRSRSSDTLHGVFYDIAYTSRDSVLRKRSRELIRQSMCIAGELGVKGVVFHTGLLAELQTEGYIRQWLEEAETFWRETAVQYRGLEIYIENTFEKTPDAVVRLAESLAEEENIKLCLDYAHACISPTPVDKWVEQLAGKIGHMHLNDNDLKADLHAVPGEGKIDFKQCRRLLEQYHIEASILLELRGVERKRRALEYMTAL